MNISYNGYNTKFLTVKGDSNVEIGRPLAFENEGGVINAVSGQNFVGVAVSVRDEVVGMQEQGYIEMAYTGTAPTYGYCKLVCGGSDNVKVGTATNDKLYKVVKVDTDNYIVGFML